MSESGRLMSGIRDAIAARDADGLARGAHTMRGMLRSLSANAAQELAGMLQSLDLESNRQQAEVACELLAQAVARLKVELRSLIDEVQSSGLGHRSGQRVSFPASAADGPP